MQKNRNAHAMGIVQLMTGVNTPLRWIMRLCTVAAETNQRVNNYKTKAEQTERVAGLLCSVYRLFA